MRSVTACTQTWLAARDFLLDRSDDFFLQLTLSRETFEAEAIHDLRVSSRRLREGIALFAHCFGKRKVALLRKELKSLTALLGAIRNTDEALLFFTPLVENCASSAAGAVMNIIATLQSKRVAEQRHLERELKKVDAGSLLGRIDDICNSPRIFDPKDRGLFQPVGEYLLEAVNIRENPMLELLPEAVEEENINSQHLLRIAVKRFRYRMEFLAPMASTDYKGVHDSLKEYQEILGHLHDLDVFSGLTGEMVTEQEGEEIKTVIMTRRHLLFAEFIRRHAESPLNEIGRRVRGLL